MLTTGHLLPHPVSLNLVILRESILYSISTFPYCNSKISLNYLSTCKSQLCKILNFNFIYWTALCATILRTFVEECIDLLTYLLMLSSGWRSQRSQKIHCHLRTYSVSVNSQTWSVRIMADNIGCVTWIKCGHIVCIFNLNRATFRWNNTSYNCVYSRHFVTFLAFLDIWSSMYRPIIILQKWLKNVSDDIETLNIRLCRCPLVGEKLNDKKMSFWF